MTTTTRTTARVMVGEVKGELLLCVGDMRDDGCTYQKIDNTKLVALIIGATGNLLPGQTTEVSLSVKHLGA